MLYVSGRNDNGYTVVDSDTNVSFPVTNVGVDFYRNGERFKMREVLGYVTDIVIAPVSKQLLHLLDYIDDIDSVVTYSSLVHGIVVGEFHFYLKSRDNIFIKLDGISPVFSILDLIVAVSDDFYFPHYIQDGSLNIGFKYDSVYTYFRISFCGDYLGYLGKLLTLYKNTDECRSKLELLEGL